jgi:Uma2 family endonuclease
LPENLTGELIDGELHTQLRPSGRHGLSETGLGAALLPPFHRGTNGPGGWWILPEVHFIRDTLVTVPDLAGWRRERMRELPDDHPLEVVPDWVCEILSPATATATAKKDRVRKLPLYAEYQVAHAWLIDPIARTLEAFALSDRGWLLIATLQDDDPVCVPPFDAVTFSLADLWS